MLISDIKPFIRFARYLQMSPDTVHPPYVPCDSRFFYTYEGEGTVKAGGRIFEMKKHTALIINAGTEYHLLPPAEAVTYIALNFDFTQEHSHMTAPVFPMTAGNYSADKIIEKADFTDIRELNSVYCTEGFAEANEKMTKIVSEYYRKILFHEIKTSNIFTEILIDFIRKAKSVASGNGLMMTDKILNFIHEYYNTPITNQSLGRQFGFHPNYISSIIKRHTGLPLHKYLLNVRMAHAIDMLDSGNHTIGAIAEKCGFCDIYYFSGYFKKIMGVSPTEYKK